MTNDNSFSKVDGIWYLTLNAAWQKNKGSMHRLCCWILSSFHMLLTEYYYLFVGTCRLSYDVSARGTKEFQNINFDCTSVNTHTLRALSHFHNPEHEELRSCVLRLLPRLQMGLLKVQRNTFNLVSFICQACLGFAYLIVREKQTPWAGSLWVERDVMNHCFRINHCCEKNIKIIKIQPHLNVGIRKAVDFIVYQNAVWVVLHIFNVFCCSLLRFLSSEPVIYPI